MGIHAFTPGCCYVRRRVLVWLSKGGMPMERHGEYEADCCENCGNPLDMTDIARACRPLVKVVELGEDYRARTNPPFRGRGLVECRACDHRNTVEVIKSGA